jgi:hypothetical protein
VVRSLEDDVGSSETTEDTGALLAMNLEWFQYEDPELDVSIAAMLYRRLSGSEKPRGNVDVNVRWEIFKETSSGASACTTRTTAKQRTKRNQSTTVSSPRCDGSSDHEL